MSPKSSIAHYRILSKLGEGGMGAVYRATDTKLNREVAIKVLPDSFAADPDRLARFTREAQVLASLNHPNIAAIYGVEEQSLVLELVEGPTLADRIAQGPIALDEALPIALQIAEALEYAHEKTIVHRDLKPANIKVTPEGRVKVLDFGLAKALAVDSSSADAASSLTMTMRGTVAGMIMGTPGYMSPEQAKGKPVDRRADIWAYGVLVTEMLTGRPMYAGETASEMLASVIKDRPDLDGLPAETPPPIRRLLRRCLEKDPQRRLQAIGEARIAIQSPEENLPVPTAPLPIARTSGIAWAAVGLAAGIALAYGVLHWMAPAPAEKPLLRFNSDMGPDALTGDRANLVISPDGSRIAYQVNESLSVPRLATMLLSQSQATVLPGTESASHMFFSPDGESIGYFVGRSLMKIPVQGGPATQLCDCASGPRGGTWATDGNIYASLDGSQIFRIPASGGKPEVVATPPAGGVAYRWPQVLPGGKAILLTVFRPGSLSENGDVAVLSLKTRQTKTVVQSALYGFYSPGGHLLYLNQKTLMGVRFDADRLETSGVAAPLLNDGVSNSALSGAQFGVSNTGILAYVSDRYGDRALPFVWLDANGTRPLLPSPPGRVTTPRLSPDGKLLAYAIKRDLWVYDPARAVSTQLTRGMGAEYPVWTPDGRAIAFMWGASGIGWVRPDGSAPPQLIYESKSLNAIPQSFSPDGQRLAFHKVKEPGSPTSRDIFQIAIDTTNPDRPKAGEPELLVATDAADADPMISPDGRWLAYISGFASGYNVFVRPYGEGAQAGGQVQITTGSGRFPMWSRTAQEIFYVSSEGRIQVVPFSVNGRTFVPGKPRLWSSTPISLNGLAYPLDIAPNGRSFVAALTPDSASARENLHVTFLLNFFDEVKRRLK